MTIRFFLINSFQNSIKPFARTGCKPPRKPLLSPTLKDFGFTILLPLKDSMTEPPFGWRRVLERWQPHNSYKGGSGDYFKFSEKRPAAAAIKSRKTPMSFPEWRQEIHSKMNNLTKDSSTLIILWEMVPEKLFARFLKLYSTKHEDYFSMGVSLSWHIYLLPCCYIFE